MNKLAVQFEPEKKEVQIQLLNTESESQQQKIRSQQFVILSVIIGIILIAVASILVFRSWKITKRSKDIISKQKIIVERKNQEITDSINYAKKIQAAILPDLNSIKEYIPQFFVLYKPKDIVSGDFYWFASFTEDWLFAVADCTGHGVPGSLVSMIGSNLLTQIAQNPQLQTLKKPSNILDSLNDELINTLQQRSVNNESKDGMDIALIRYKQREQQLEYAGANRPLYHFSNEILNEVKPDKCSIGGCQRDKFRFKNNSITIKRGDTIYLSTDGYSDQFGEVTGKKIMTKRLKELLTEIQSFSMEDQRRKLDDFIENWKGMEEQIDDILVVGIKF